MANANSTSLNNLETTMDLAGWTPEELQQIENNCMNEDTFTNRIVEIAKASPALWTKEQMYQMENRIQQDQIRRVAFCFGLSTGQELLEKIENDREFAVIAGGVFSELPKVIQKYKSLVEIFESIHQRLMIGLDGREDMKDVISEGEASLIEN